MIRLLPPTCADGPANMAADEALLESAAAGVASLRFYTWAAPTFSLGYFQPAAEREGCALPWLRRASGGAALVHDAELTYALALPAGLPWQRRGESWLCRMHGVIAATLVGFGVVAQTCGAEQKLGPVLCFLHHTAGDLILNGHKVVGSAQRKQRGAILQHGGILLAQSRHTPSLPGIRELAGVEIPAAELADAIATEVTRQTECELLPSDWTELERARIRELSHTKYADAGWNTKR